VTSLAVQTEEARRQAKLILDAVGISRIVVVDDEYANESMGVEDLIGVCAEESPDTLLDIPHLSNVDFSLDLEIWAPTLRRRWAELSEDERSSVLAVAKEISESQQQQALPLPTDAVEVAETMGQSGTPISNEGMAVDTKAAVAIEAVLKDLEGGSFQTLSLSEWGTRGPQLLADEDARSTVFLFDRDFSREGDSENKGFELVRDVLEQGVGYCGLITHTVPPGGEYTAWSLMAEQHGLDRDRFVVISKQNLTADPCDHQGFLRGVRLAALSGRCSALKSATWSVFEASIEEAKAAVDQLSVADFDQIVLASSRREGVWEPETLFRIYSILMRREARRRLHDTKGTDVPSRAAEARRMSRLPEEVPASLIEYAGEGEALQIQRFEVFDLDDLLNPIHRPIELGDVFEKASTRKRFILLAQPCDLMVRSNGKRNYEDKKLGRHAALIELLVGRSESEAKKKPNWVEVPYFEQKTGGSAYANLSSVHYVRLAVLDLCSFQEDGRARIDTTAECPDGLVDSWCHRYSHIRKLFQRALTKVKALEEKSVAAALSNLALPAASATLGLEATIDGDAVEYEVRRVLHLNQPRSGALLTQFSQYLSRTAFEHPFDDRLPIDDETRADQDSGDGSRENEGEHSCRTSMEPGEGTS